MIGTKHVKKNGKTYTYPRNYVTEYSQRTEAQKDNRYPRMKARNKMIQKYGKKYLIGKDEDHVHGVKAGNSSSNLRVTSVKFNRGRKSTRWR